MTLQRASSMTMPRTWPIDLGDEMPTFRVRYHCRVQRKYVVSPDADSRERLLPSGPPFGGVPTGILTARSCSL